MSEDNQNENKQFDYWNDNGIIKPSEIIVCAANKLESGLILCGARHWDKLMKSQAKAANLTSSEMIKGHVQGFINQFGEFRTREEALKIVLENGQRFYKERNGSDTELFSEGLY